MTTTKAEEEKAKSTAEATSMLATTAIAFGFGMCLFTPMAGGLGGVVVANDPGVGSVVGGLFLATVLSWPAIALGWFARRKARAIAQYETKAMVGLVASLVAAALGVAVMTLLALTMKPQGG